MRTKFCLYLFSIFTVASAIGSPTIVRIDSLEMLKRLNIQIEYEVFDGHPEWGPNAKVRIVWKPIQKDRNSPPRIGVVRFQSTESAKQNKKRIFKTSSLNAEGVCVSKFQVRVAVAEHYQLVFWNGEREVSGVSLIDVLNGFSMENSSGGMKANADSE